MLLAFVLIAGVLAAWAVLWTKVGPPSTSCDVTGGDFLCGSEWRGTGRIGSIEAMAAGDVAPGVPGPELVVVSTRTNSSAGSAEGVIQLFHVGTDFDLLAEASWATTGAPVPHAAVVATFGDSDSPRIVVAGDVTDPDLGYRGQLSVWAFRNGTLELTDIVEWSTFGQTRAYSVAVGDVDGDGRQDLVVGGGAIDLDLGELSVWTLRGGLLNRTSDITPIELRGRVVKATAMAEVDSTGADEILLAAEGGVAPWRTTIGVLRYNSSSHGGDWLGAWNSSLDIDTPTGLIVRGTGTETAAWIVSAVMSEGRGAALLRRFGVTAGGPRYEGEWQVSAPSDDFFATSTSRISAAARSLLIVAGSSTSAGTQATARFYVLDISGAVPDSMGHIDPRRPAPSIGSAVAQTASGTECVFVLASNSTGLNPESLTGLLTAVRAV